MVDIVINYVAVLVAAVVSMFIGGCWYSPMLFGNAWVRLMKISPKEQKEMKAKGAGKSFVGMFVSVLLMSYVLAYAVAYTGASGLFAALQLAFWIWLGFIATVMFGIVLWERRPVSLYLLNVSYQLVVLIAMTLILVYMG